MKIGLVSYGLQTGGVSTFIMRLADHLLARHEVSFIATGSSGRWNHLLERMPGLRAVHLPVEVPLARSYACSIARWLDRERFDLLFLNHSKWAQRSLPMLSSRPAIVPIIHSDDPDVCTTAISQAGFWDRVVAVSPKVRDRATTMLGTAEPIELIISGIPIPSAEELALRAPHSQPLRLVYLSNLYHRQKGCLYLAEIVAGCRDRGVPFELTVIGDGPDRMALEQSLEAKGVAEWVRLLGVIEPAAVYRELLAAHVLVHPSRCEGMPLSVLEAMACGCVPVVSRLPAITDVAIEDGESGFLADPDRLTTFIDAIVALAASADRWSAASGAAVARAKERFSMERCHNGYDRLIDALADQRTASRSTGARRYRVPLTWRDHLRLVANSLHGRS